VQLHLRPTPASIGVAFLRLCLQPTSDLRQPSIVWRCQGVDFQLPPELHPALHLQISFQLAPDTASSDFAFGPTSNSSSVDCIFQLYLPANLPACADLPTFRFCLQTGFRLSPELQSSSFTFGLNSDSRRNSHPPVLPSNPTSDSSSEPASPTSPSSQLPICTGRRPSWICPPFDLRLSPASHLRAFPSHPASDLRRNLHPPVLSATNLRSRSEFESSGGAVDLQPTCVGF